MNEVLRERALRLLARREHSRIELARKLAPHSESAEQLGLLLDELCQRGLLSDERYAEMRLNARLARYGNARLANELRMQGVEHEVLNVALAQAELDHPEIDRARELWQRKFGERAAPDDVREVARQTRFLMSRGFSAEIIRRVMRSASEDN